MISMGDSADAETAAREMWLSVRKIRRIGDPEWADYSHFIGLPRLQELRTIDSWCNPCVDGNYPVYSLDELWDRMEILPRPVPGNEYYLVFTDAIAPGPMPIHPRMRLLGYDLSDETWTSSLLNCGRWLGELEPIAMRTGENGLLNLEDAVLARSLLPKMWPDDPHANVTVWALYEVLPDDLGDDA